MVAESTRWHPAQATAQKNCTREWIEENPFTSMTAVYGIGMAVGLLLGHTIAEAAGRHMFHHNTFAENLTGKIRDLITSNLPKDIGRHFS